MPKEDYKPPYDLRKISRYNPKSSIADIFSEDIYFGLKDTKDNIAKTVTQLYDSSIGVLVKDKERRYQFLTVTATMGAGFLTALTFNLLGADYAHARDFAAEKLSSHSFKLETIAHASFSLLTFMTLSTIRYRKNGYSFWRSMGESAKDLALLTAVSAPISLIIYNHFRDVMVIKDIADGIDPRMAVFRAQGKLVLPYYFSVIASLKMLKYTISMFRTKKNNSNGNGIQNKSIEKNSVGNIDEKVNITL